METDLCLVAHGALGMTAGVVHIVAGRLGFVRPRRAFRTGAHAQA
jgi:hypothetical protein